jgi:hypothetical protein
MESQKLFEGIIEDDVLDFDIGEFLEPIKAKCDAEKITYKIVLDTQGCSELFINAPLTSGETRELRILTVDECKKLLQSEFQLFSYITDFQGIYSSKLGLIECVIQGFASNSPVTDRRRLNTRLQKPIIINHSENEEISIRIGQVSKELAALTGIDPKTLSIQFCGLIPTPKLTVQNLLIKYSNNIFFQLETRFSYSYTLARGKPIASNNYLIRRNQEPDNLELTFPKIEFEHGPISLYWYGKSAAQMPLLRYLAYYQIAEYSFPRFSKHVAHVKIQDLLKDPNFRADRDSDIEKIFKTLKLTNNGRLGNEKSQFQAVLQECLHPKEIIEFVSKNDARKSQLCEGKDKLSQFKIPIKSEDNIISSTANRLYEIRCKIVHTKNDIDDTKLDAILPYSVDADKLEHDIALMKFIAEKVIVKTGTFL